MEPLAAPPRPLPFELGEERSFRGLTIVPLFPTAPPRLEYIGLDEAVARGLKVDEVDSDGVVQTLVVDNPLSDRVLFYEGEELIGAKQNRIIRGTALVEAQTTTKLAVHCVERGRWALSSARFAPAPRAAYPELRRAQRAGQAAVWAEIGAKQSRMRSFSQTDAAEQLYVDHRRPLDRYAAALSRVEGQAGALVGIGGRIACLDYVSRSDVFAGLYGKLLRGYALSAMERPIDRPLRKADIGRFLGELELAALHSQPASGVGETRRFDGYAIGSELVFADETVALAAFPARA